MVALPALLEQKGFLARLGQRNPPGRCTPGWYPPGEALTDMAGAGGGAGISGCRRVPGRIVPGDWLCWYIFWRSGVETDRDVCLGRVLRAVLHSCGDHAAVREARTQVHCQGPHGRLLLLRVPADLRGEAASPTLNLCARSAGRIFTGDRPNFYPTGRKLATVVNFVGALRERDEHTQCRCRWWRNFSGRSSPWRWMRTSVFHQLAN